MPDVLGHFLGGLFGLVGNGIQTAVNTRLQDRQNQFNLEMWNKNNEYNSPQAQMRRYEEAGLNSALMYGNVSSGNSSSAPVKGVPQMPEWSKSMKELAQAFNIVGLKEQIANMRKAQAEAKISEVAADREQASFDADAMLGGQFMFDPSTGLFKEVAQGYSDLNRYSAANFYKMKYLSDNFRTNSLLIPRFDLIGSQRSLNLKRQELLAPQIRYWNFNTVPWRMNTRFWLGNARTGAQILTPFLNW